MYTDEDIGNQPASCINVGDTAPSSEDMEAVTEECCKGVANEWGEKDKRSYGVGKVVVFLKLLTNVSSCRS